MEKYPEAGLEENFCRNPNKEEADTIWCFVKMGENKGKTWEYCDPINDKKEPLTAVTFNAYKEFKLFGW